LGVVPAPKPGSPWEDADTDHKKQKKRANFFIFEKKDECGLNSKKVRNAQSEASQFLPEEINLSIEYTWNLGSYTNFFAPMVFF
jgi:hypothetical protein